MHWPPVTLSILAIIAGVCLVFDAFHRWRRRQRDRFASCGRCGYRATAAVTFTCPECGADWREVGLGVPARAASSLEACILVLGLSLVTGGGLWLLFLYS